MKKLSFLFLVLLLFLTACAVPSTGNNGIVGIPKGEFLAAYDSPNGEYTLNVWLCNGGATTDYAIRGELLNHKTNMRKNIYWNYHESDAAVQWVDDNTVTVNGHTLNILEDTYDFRWD